MMTIRQWIISIAIVTAGCNSGDKHEQLLSNATQDASCPFMTTTPDGHTVISWVETAKGADTGTLYYAVSADKGRTFSAPRRVATANGILPHAENMPKMVFKPDGEVIAIYGVEQNDARNKYAGRVYYTRSLNGGETWLPAVPLVTDTGSYDQRYFDIALLPGGEAAAIWLDNRKAVDAEGSSLYFAVTDGRDGFKKERALAETVCQCCRTDLYTDAQGGIHIAFRDIINDSIRDMVHMVSTDGGNAFSKLNRISADNWVVRGCPHTGPAMTKNKQSMHFTWFTMGGGEGVYYCQSTDNGQTYTQKQKVSIAPMAKHPQIATLADDRILLVWDEPVKQPDNTFKSRVGYQWRDGGGKVLQTGVLTTDSTHVTYPVITGVDDGTVLMAYTQRAGDLQQVRCMLVKQ
ncbi:sialidase family protein [Chitinophaga rhizophila]|uniref:Glycoside hydrolase n=1 Tax=Chitinophaga rhizophila TaxID=2866212 RepID=A0ABS7GCP9_9BACT|nr:sialidase family protein [Chitinophaga rhizophila]MBW8685447.1 glycoside hydrolase [Chitinophaga rhizophila]